ncbi:MAG: dTMP kinase [Methanothrix sp.]|nr:dTMP kinase [Methanothrix sp.]
MKGLLITLEGIDGSGKSTAAKQIASRLAELMPERRLVLTAEPTTGQVGKILRAELARASSIETRPPAAKQMQELFLFMADHAHHLTKTVLPALETGAIVLSDRYADSTAAYQGVTLRGIVPDPVHWIQSIYRPWNLLPDRTLLFVLDPHAALQRMQSRRGRQKFERLEFLRLVDENFRRLAALEPERFVQIDAEQDAKKVAEEAIKAILNVIYK